MSVNKSQIIDAIRTVHDPEIPVNLYDLGLVYDLDINDDGAVHVQMTLTTPNCPVAEQMPQQVKEAVESVEGVSGADIELFWEPRWSTDMMSEEAKMQLDMMGISWSDPLAGGGTTGLTVGRRKPGEKPGG